MKIRTTEDVEILDSRIKDELGIDVRKYRNEEVVEDFVELLVFPEYVLTWVLKPILISVVIFIMGFFKFDLVHIELIIYACVGFVLFFTLGILIGLLFLIRRMKTDMWGIVDYSLEMMKSAVNDLKQVNDQITPENRKNALGLLFKGIIHIVTIPMVAKVVSAKVPLIDGLINRLLKKVLTVVSDKVKFDEEKLNEELKKSDGETTAIQLYSNAISAVSIGLEKVMNLTFGIAQLPIFISFIFNLLILVLFLILIN